MGTWRRRREIIVKGNENVKINEHLIDE